MSDDEVETKSKSGIYNMPKIILMIISGGLGGLSVGYNSGVVATALLFIDTKYPGIDTSTKAVLTL